MNNKATYLLRIKVHFAVLALKDLHTYTKNDAREHSQVSKKFLHSISPQWCILILEPQLVYPVANSQKIINNLTVK